MNKLITTSSAALSALFLITGCSSDDGGSGITVPANAATIGASNAFTLVQRATTTGYAITEATEGNSIPNGLADCSPTGSSTNNIIVSGDLFTTLSESTSGTVTLNDCGTYVNGIPDTYFIDGTLTISYIESINIATDDITSTGTIIGNNIGLTITDMATPTDTVTVNSLNTRRTSSTDFFSGTGTYTVTSQFSYDSRGLKEGFFVQTTTPLEGVIDWWGTSCPTKGVVLVTGAAGSQARGSFANNGTVLIEYHTGDYKWVTDTTYACSSFES